MFLLQLPPSAPYLPPAAQGLDRNPESGSVNRYEDFGSQAESPTSDIDFDLHLGTNDPSAHVHVSFNNDFGDLFDDDDLH
jgi:hypothetical protein